MILDPIFDLFRPRYKDPNVYVTITYEDGTKKIEKLEGVNMNDSMGELHRKWMKLKVDDYDRRVIELLNRNNQEQQAKVTEDIKVI